MSQELRRTPLFDRHVAAGARLVEFGGWEMPVQYQGLIEEHRAVRTAAGLFDVSHMGEFRVKGENALAFVQQMTPNDASKLTPGRAHYSALLTPDGTFVDDLLVYRMAEDEFMLVVNAGNLDGDFAWVLAQPTLDVEVENVSDAFALIAVQGPRAAGIVQGLTRTPLDGIRYYHFARGEVAGRPTIFSRTGYTGEDGFELYLDPADAPAIWDALLAAGGPAGLVPAGLGARDTLRLEAGMALYGHEIDRTTTPWEAGLDWIVKMDKGDFVGREALAAAREAGLERRLVGFEVTGRGIARQGHRLLSGGRDVGFVTSGTFSPTFEKALGMAYVETALSAVGTPIEIDVRGRAVPARVAALPFYKRAR